MDTSFSRSALTLLLLAAGCAAALRGQTAQVRAKVSATLPHYDSDVQVKGAVEIPGTDALTDLGAEWDSGFRQHHPEGRITFLPSLTTDAVKSMVEGKANLIVTARELTADETKAFQAKFGYLPMRIPVCLDAIIVFVHKSNPLSAISMEQLDAIYSKSRLGGGKEAIKTWGDLGVRGDLAKRPINAYSRAEGTATRQAFAAMALLKGEYRPGIIDRPDSASLAEAVLTDVAGIAFGPMASWYAANRVLAVEPYQGSDARPPSQDAVTSSKYPMPRLYYAYLNRAPGKPLDPAISEVLHYILSQEGQNAVADAGLLPGPVEFITIALKRLGR
jgi:phosphate transport system substrate-binding protein